MKIKRKLELLTLTRNSGKWKEKSIHRKIIINSLGKYIVRAFYRAFQCTRGLM
jgi:hypothetical protein